MDNRRSGSVDEEAKIRQKHQVLLQEFLVLQKECVMRKRKLKEVKQKKGTLLDEIRFLKRRRSVLLKIQSQNSETQKDGVEWQKRDANCDMEASERCFNVSEPPFQNSRPAMDNIRKEEVGFAPLRLGKKTKDLFTDGKRSVKRNISWQDQVALKV